MNGAVAAAALRQGARLDALSRFITAGAVLGLVLRVGSVWVLAAVVVLGLCELYYAMRVGFDAELFALGDTDGALVEFGLLPPAKAGRSIALKFTGAKRLLVWQTTALLLQVLVIFFGVLFSGASPVVHQESQRIPKALPLAGSRGGAPGLC